MCNHVHYLHAHHRHSIFCILPPYILSQIVQSGSDQQRSSALGTLRTDQTFRTLRATNQSPAGAVLGKPVTATEEGQKQRTIYTAKNTQTLPGTVVRAEGAPPSGDPAVDEAYDGLGDTFDFYWEVFERNSINDQGLPLDATVHFGDKYDNAFWDGSRMVFGDGDGELFNRFTIAIDVIGHELTHGVTEDEAKLTYMFQPGALNESISDVFGSLIKQRALNQTADKADWLIGAGLFTKNVKGTALRSMKAPGTAYDDPVLGKDPQPASMKHFVRTYQDNGGVHINSGIPNRAFYLVATKLGGYAWEKAGKIWYETLRNSSLRPGTGFKSFARLTATVAGRLYGANSVEQKAIQESWAEVDLPIT
jgi:Zn-dependent metalloprotease